MLKWQKIADDKANCNRNEGVKRFQKSGVYSMIRGKEAEPQTG
jgi:hypothetical protein